MFMMSSGKALGSGGWRERRTDIVSSVKGAWLFRRERVCRLPQLAAGHQLLEAAFDAGREAGRGRAWEVVVRGCPLRRRRRDVGARAGAAHCRSAQSCKSALCDEAELPGKAPMLAGANLGPRIAICAQAVCCEQGDADDAAFVFFQSLLAVASWLPWRAQASYLPC